MREERWQTLTLNVPYKALSSFANKSGERISLDSSAGRMIIYYNKLSANDILLPYTFGAETGLKRRLIFHDAWVQMIKDNTVNILGWIQCEKVKWLQNNNPEVPGLIYKLAPLDEKMRKLAHVRKLWDGILDIRSVTDVFTDEAIDKQKYEVDHFIPWSFVMNDELWNLMPMDSSLNSAKNNPPVRLDARKRIQPVPTFTKPALTRSCVCLRIRVLLIWEWVANPMAHLHCSKLHAGKPSDCNRTGGK